MDQQRLYTRLGELVVRLWALEEECFRLRAFEEAAKAVQDEKKVSE
jgi:hypothetical protein